MMQAIDADCRVKYSADEWQRMNVANDLGRRLRFDIHRNEPAINCRMLPQESRSGANLKYVPCTVNGGE